MILKNLKAGEKPHEGNVKPQKLFNLPLKLVRLLNFSEFFCLYKNYVLVFREMTTKNV